MTPRFRPFRRLGKTLLDWTLAPVGLVIVLPAALLALARSGRRQEKPRLLWGALPIKTLSYASRAMRQRGYVSDVWVIELYPIVTAEDFDRICASRLDQRSLWGYVANSVIAFMALSRALGQYDVFHYFFDGGLLQRTALKWIEFPLLRLAGKRLVLMPYGSDSFVYDLVQDQGWRHALMINYPDAGYRAGAIQSFIRYGSRWADCVVGCLVHTVNLPRVDVLPLTWYPIDVERLQPVAPATAGPVRIGHAPNHRGPKGTDFLLRAVDRLRANGHEIDLVLIEKVPNARAIEMIASVDIFVDQLIFGYALAALEGMALGKVVVTGYDLNAPEYRAFSRYSFLRECPAAPASPETIYEVLADLIARRAQWPMIGAATRAFAEQRHSPAFVADLFEAIYRRIWRDEKIDLISMYNPGARGDLPR